jgi:hypothetical protein
MPLAILLLLVEVAFVVHAIRTGKDTYWIYIIIFVPVVGCIAYFITQILPDLSHSRTIKKVENSLLKAIDPQRELKRRKDELELSDTLDNRLRLADECVEAGFTDDAISLYENCLKGVHEDNPHIMLKLAQAHFKSGDNDKTKLALERLIESNPDFKSADGHLLYARSLENLALLDDAIKEYEILARSYPGEEARVRYGLLLQKNGQTEAAQKLFNKTLQSARLAPKYYRKKEKQWIRIAKENSR